MESCPDCGKYLNAAGECMNVNCPGAHRAATRTATMPKAKATAAATRDNPLAVSRSGRVD